MPGSGDSRPREFTAEERDALSRWSPGFSRSAAFEEPLVNHDDKQSPKFFEMTS